MTNVDRRNVLLGGAALTALALAAQPIIKLQEQEHQT